MKKRESYRTDESIAAMFWHSCLGKLVVLIALIAVVLIVAFATRPSVEKMQRCTVDDVRQSLLLADSIKTDGLDDALNSIYFAFSSADSVDNDTLEQRFYRENRLFFNAHTFYSTTYIYNNSRAEGIRCEFGIFGIVMPLVNYKQFISREGTLRRGYDHKILEVPEPEDKYFGENPDLGGIFEYEEEY